MNLFNHLIMCLKNNLLSRKLKNNSGIIIIVVMWVLVILSTLAISLSRKTSVELSLTKYAIAKQKARYLAWAGFMQAARMIQLDGQNQESNQNDNLFYCGIPKKEDLNPEEMFKEKMLGAGHFSVEYKWQPNALGSEEKIVYGMSDEERKINLNAMIPQNNAILVSLLTLLDVGDEEAKIIAAAVIDWVDEDSVLTQEPYGAENEYYEALDKPYKPKNKPFDSVEELVLIRGMNKEILQKIRPFVTVFPKDGELKVNFDTASEIVLRAIARAFTGVATNTDLADADSLAAKIIEHRSGDDRMEFTDDDIFIDIGTVPLNAKEKVLGLVINQYRTRISEYLRVRAVGVDSDRGISAGLDAVLQRDDLSIVYWKRE